MDRPDSEEMVTIPVASRRTGLGIRQLRRGIDRGQLPAYDVGGWPRLRWREVVAWIESQRRPGTGGSAEDRR